ncbi:G-type lectin S-receptor-like serine/threonine-protein kinase SD2-5 [Linum grandiflorum]
MEASRRRSFLAWLPPLLLFLLQWKNSTAGVRFIGKMDPGFQGAQMNWIDNTGMFLVSNNSLYGFGFKPTSTDVTKFLLAVVHMSTTKPIWSANRDSPVSNSDRFIFSKDGKASLQKGQGFVWRADTGFKTPQQYWSMGRDNRRTIDSNGGDRGLFVVATVEGNSWKLYGDASKRMLLSQFVFSDSSAANDTWIVVMGSDGFVSFYNLDAGGAGGGGTAVAAAPVKIPDDPCDRPVSCGAYLVCKSNNVCQCPSILNSQPNCNPGLTSDSCKGSTMLVDAGNQLNYFALKFVNPTATRTDLESCKLSCRGNCSCVGLFFSSGSGSCFLFDELGSFKAGSSTSNSGFSAFIKVSGRTTSGGGDRFPFGAIIAIAVTTVLVIVGLLFVAYRIYRRKSRLAKFMGDDDGSEEDDMFLENLSGMPVRFSYKELQTATNNFSVKLGQGGFGSVYQGLLPDGTRLAVKKLEGIGQGKKEFRAEVSIIGSTHHHHLVRLKGFCAEGSHRMLAYEFMANGSLEQWIFKRKKKNDDGDEEEEDFLLDWETRFNIALGTAKGLAYLHQDCDAKIVHCDIKPENVLLDDNFLAKVSDFGLAKLMTREQSHVFTTMRGTRGYLAPEWITNYAISEKSDVYSYGMLLLEIISGRKNFIQPTDESSEKSHFPSYAFKMMEEGKLREILDSKLKLDEQDERVGTAIKVALWCIQEDMYVRPSMTKVVQMLEGIYAVPKPPTSSPLTARLYSGIFKSISEEGASSGQQSDCNSDAYQSAVRLSGPR